MQWVVANAYEDALFTPVNQTEVHHQPQGRLRPSPWEPVMGYFYRRLIRKVFATRDRDPRLYQWFRKTFRPDDYLRPHQAAEWPYIHCIHCGDIHECGNEEEEEERQYQKDQQAF